MPCPRMRSAWAATSTGPNPPSLDESPRSAPLRAWAAVQIVTPRASSSCRMAPERLPSGRPVLPGPCHTDQPDALMLQLCQLQGGLPGVGRHYDLVDSLLPGGFHRQLQGGFGVLGSLSVKCHGASSCFQSRHNRPMGAKSRPQRHNRCPRLLYHAAGRFCNAPARNPLSPAGNV
mgnify:CR=1 FL=1